MNQNNLPYAKKRKTSDANAIGFVYKFEYSAEMGNVQLFKACLFLLSQTLWT